MRFFFVFVDKSHGAFDGVGYSLTGPKVNMVSYRSEASALLSGSTVVDLTASTPGDNSALTSVRFNTTVASLEAATGVSMASGDLLDVRVAIIGTNIYEYALLTSSNTAAAAASRADQQSANNNGILLLRSKLTAVEVASEGDALPLSVTGLGPEGVRVTLLATHPFNTSFDAFERSFACPTNGEVRIFLY